MWSQILEERKSYSDVLEKAQAASPDITGWLAKAKLRASEALC